MVVPARAVVRVLHHMDDVPSPLEQPKTMVCFSRSARRQLKLNPDSHVSTKRHRSPTVLVLSDDEKSGEGQDVPAPKKAKVVVVKTEAKMTDGVGSELLQVEDCIKRALETQESIRTRLSRVWDYSMQLTRLYEKGTKEMEELDDHIQALRRALAEK